MYVVVKSIKIYVFKKKKIEEHGGESIRCKPSYIGNLETQI
jgi:hypothetical protein